MHLILAKSIFNLVIIAERQRNMLENRAKCCIASAAILGKIEWKCRMGITLMNNLRYRLNLFYVAMLL